MSASVPLAYNPYLQPGQLMSPLLQQEVTPPIVSHPTPTPLPTQPSTTQQHPSTALWD